MRFCHQCWAEMQDRDKFCMNCGSAYVENDGATSTLPKDTASTQQHFGQAKDDRSEPVVSVQADLRLNSPPRPKRGSGLRTKLILGAILAIILAAGGLWGWNTYGTKAQAEKKLDLAVKYLSDNNYEQAILAFNDAIKIDPKEVKGYQGLARTYTLQGNYDEAKSTYEKGIAAVTPQYLQVLQLSLAGMYIDQNKLTDAEQAYTQIMNTGPNCLESYLGLAMVYQQQGNNSKAEAILRQAVEKNPNEYQVYNALALFLFQNHKQDDALNNIVQSLSLEINQQEAYLVLDSIYKNNWAGLRSQTSGVSNQTVGSMLEFYTYYAAADYSNAIDTFKGKLALQTGNHKAKLLAAVCMVKNGDQTSAENLIQQIDVSKLNPTLIADLGYYYLAAGDRGKANNYAIEALQGDGANFNAIALLQTINDENTARIYIMRVMLFSCMSIDSINKALELNEINIPAYPKKSRDTNNSTNNAVRTEDDIDSKGSGSDNNKSADEQASQSKPASVLNSSMFQWRGVKAGMKEQQVLSLVGNPDQKMGTETGWHWLYGNISITWSWKEPKVVRGVGWFNTLDNKIFAGDSYEKLIATYGQPNRTQSNDTGAGFYAIYENQFGMIKFVIIQGKVVKVGIGDIFFV